MYSINYQILLILPQFRVSMVLPWISDRGSPAVRNGLLGSPYFDFDSKEIIFSFDDRRSNNLKQSSFFNLKVGGYCNIHSLLLEFHFRE